MHARDDWTFLTSIWLFLRCVLSMRSPVQGAITPLPNPLRYTSFSSLPPCIPYNLKILILQYFRD